MLVRPLFRGDHAEHLQRLGAAWNGGLNAWVIEPTPELRFDRSAGEWRPRRVWTEHFRVERGLKDLGQVQLEWQVGGPSALPRGHEDVEPAGRNSRGWSTYYPPDGKVPR